MLLTGFKLSNKNSEAKFMIYNWGVVQSNKINCPAGVALGYRVKINYINIKHKH